MYGQATFDKSPKKFSKEVSFFSSSSVGAARKVSEKVNFNPPLPVPKKKKNVSEVAYRSKHKSLDYELLGRKGKKMSSFHKHASGKNLEESMKRVYAKHSSKARGATFGNGRKLKICSRLARATWQEHLFFNP